MLLCMLDVARNHQLLAQCCAAWPQGAKNKKKTWDLKPKYASIKFWLRKIPCRATCLEYLIVSCCHSPHFCLWRLCLWLTSLAWLETWIYFNFNIIRLGTTTLIFFFQFSLFLIALTFLTWGNTTTAWPRLWLQPFMRDWGTRSPPTTGPWTSASKPEWTTPDTLSSRRWAVWLVMRRATR